MKQFAKPMLLGLGFGILAAVLSLMSTRPLAASAVLNQHEQGFKRLRLQRDRMVFMP
jgi:hypothetical protein